MKFSDIYTKFVAKYYEILNWLKGRFSEINPLGISDAAFMGKAKRELIPMSFSIESRLDRYKEFLKKYVDITELENLEKEYFKIYEKLKKFGPKLDSLGIMVYYIGPDEILAHHEQIQDGIRIEIDSGKIVVEEND